MSQIRVSRMKPKPPLVPLGTLIGRELRTEKVENPTIKYGQAALAKKGEDYFLIKPDCQRISGNPSTSFLVFAVIALSIEFYKLVQKFIMFVMPTLVFLEHLHQILHISN